MARPEKFPQRLSHPIACNDIVCACACMCVCGGGGWGGADVARVCELMQLQKAPTELCPSFSQYVSLSIYLSFYLSLSLPTSLSLSLCRGVQSGWAVVDKKKCASFTVEASIEYVCFRYV